MARKTGGRGSGKVIIRVFCEGESEQAYTEFLKHKFSDVAVIEYPKELGYLTEQVIVLLKIHCTETIKRLLTKFGSSLMLKQRILIK